MSNNKIFQKVPIEIPNKSGFDMSHENLFTGKVGTLVPVLCDELLPNDTISLGQTMNVQLPPMATDFYGRVEMRLEAFFVPNRILWAGWQDFISNKSNNGSTLSYYVGNLPNLALTTSLVAKMGAGSLSDYLDYGADVQLPTGNTVYISNVLPFMAYHRIYEDWYRDSRIQTSIFNRDYTAPLSPATLPFMHDPYDGSLTGPNFADGVSLLDLRQRNYPRDYFTNCTPKPQAGDASVLSFGVDDTTHQGSFTIAALRAANSLQKWLERNNIAGERYADQILAQYGILPSDATIDRAIYLGSSRFDVYNKSVFNATDNSTPSTRNPFGTVGAKFGSPLGVGEGSMVDSFTASEHGHLIVLASLVPLSYYEGGKHKMFDRRQVGDFAFPLLAGVGDQEVYVQELASTITPNLFTTFGYTQRYSEYKFKNDRCHGLLRSGESLEAFALKRGFTVSTQLGSSFIQIPTTALDDVSAAEESVSDYGYWADIYFKYRKISTLPAYSIPTLGEMPNTHTEVIDNGGRRL